MGNKTTTGVKEGTSTKQTVIDSRLPAGVKVDVWFGPRPKK